MQKLTPEELEARKTRSTGTQVPVYGLLDNIRSLYNVGSMFRTSDGAGICKLFLCGYTPKPPRKEIEKTSLGSVNTVPWEHFTDPLHAIARLKQANIRICVLEQTTRSIPFHRLRSIEFPVCLVVGNEITGVSAPFLANADHAIEIPMYGMKHSLNAAVAYGIGIYELIRIGRNEPAQGEMSKASVK